MIQAASPFFARVFGLAALLLLGACGGGAEPEAGAVPQSIHFSLPGEQTFGTAAAPLAATSTSGLAVVFASATPTVCSVSGVAMTLLAAGQCTIDAVQPGDKVYAAATPVATSFAVRPAAQTIHFIAPGNQTLGSAPAALVASATSALPVALRSSTPGVCTVAGSTLTALGLGSCTVVASQPGNANYQPAPAVSHAFAVGSGLAAQAINFASPGNQTLGTVPAALAATATSGLPVSLTSLTPGVCTVSGSTLTLVSAGPCTVGASQAGSAAFSAAAVVLNTVDVALRTQTIRFVSPGAQALGSAAPALAASSSAGLTVAFASATPGVCTVSGSTLTLLAVGTCTIDASQAGNPSTAAATGVSASFTVTVALQSISFALPGSQTLGTAPAPLLATASSGLPVLLAASTASVCSVSGTALTLLAAGTCTVSASQPGNASYSAAPAVSHTFTVVPAALLAQSINFASPGSQTLGSAPAPLLATATSGLPVSFSASTAPVCSVSGTALTLLAAGTCTVSASQAGNTSYSAAPAVSHTFTVAAAALLAQSISFTSPGGQTLGSAPAPLLATATSGLPVLFLSTTPSVCSVSGTALALLAAGTCTISASQAGNASYSAAPALSRTFTVAPAALLAQSISFTAPGGQTLGSAPAALLATATSGLPVLFLSTTPSVCSVSGTALTLLAAGTCTVSASQAGNAVFAPAVPASNSFSVAAAAQSISFAVPASQTLGTAPAPLVATSTSGLPVVLASLTPATCSVSGNTLGLIGAGTCTLLASQAGNATFAMATPISRTFTIAAAPIERFANGGFETPGLTTPALGWLGANLGYTLTTDAHSGVRAALLSANVTSTAAVLLQNSKDQGGLPDLVVGESLMLSFWAKGTPGTTGDLIYALRFLNSNGNILAPTVGNSNVNFGAQINPNTWTKITRAALLVPTGATAAFLEISSGIGPVDPANGFFAGSVKIDDISLQRAP